MDAVDAIRAIRSCGGIVRLSADGNVAYWVPQDRSEELACAIDAVRRDGCRVQGLLYAEEFLSPEMLADSPEALDARFGPPREATLFLVDGERLALCGSFVDLTEISRAQCFRPIVGVGDVEIVMDLYTRKETA